MRQCALTPHLLSSHFAKYVQPLFEVKVSNIPHSKSLLILKAGYMYTAVFYIVMHGILLYTFSQYGLMTYWPIWIYTEQKKKHYIHPSYILSIKTIFVNIATCNYHFADIRQPQTPISFLFSSFITDLSNLD